jgi:hypothetical protein
VKTGDILYYSLLATVCSALAYLMLRDIWRKPDYTVTKRMIREAEMEAIFGDEYELEDEDDDDEYVDL